LNNQREAIVQDDVERRQPDLAKLAAAHVPIERSEQFRDRRLVPRQGRIGDADGAVNQFHRLQRKRGQREIVVDRHQLWSGRMTSLQ